MGDLESRKTEIPMACSTYIIFFVCPAGHFFYLNKEVKHVLPLEIFKMGLNLFPNNIHTRMKAFLKTSDKQFLKYFDRDYIRLPVNQFKKALVKNWNNYNGNYHKEKRTIKQLLAQYQTYALRTGKRLGNDCFFIVLDLDRNYWGQQIWELGIAWINTKRGGHIYILIKELPSNGLLFNQTKQKIGEIQSQGKYVIGLGSFHQTGIRYNWERNKASKWWWKFETVKEMEAFLLEKGILCQFKKQKIT